MNKIYTAGYQGHTPEQLKKAAEQLDAVVCDIRYSPFSKIPGWSGGALRAVLGKRYLHVREWGNVNFKTGEAPELNNAAAGLLKVLRLHKAQSVILLCGCKEYSSCHRKMCAELFHERGDTTRELKWPVDESAIEHHCHARGCDVKTDPKMLMCAKHWRMVPRALQNAVWRYYREGQEKDKQPSREYMNAATLAIKAVAEREALEEQASLF